jgi:HEAT repeat protein
MICRLKKQCRKEVAMAESLTMAQVAALTGLHKNTIRKYVKLGDLKDPRALGPLILALLTQEEEQRFRIIEAIYCIGESGILEEFLSAINGSVEDLKDEKKYPLLQIYSLQSTMAELVGALDKDEERKTSILEELPNF